MDYPAYIYVKDRHDRMRHWSGPWENEALLQDALSLAKLGYPKQAFLRCGTSIHTLEGVKLEDGSWHQFDKPSERLGPDFNSLQPA